MRTRAQALTDARGAWWHDAPVAAPHTYFFWGLNPMGDMFSDSGEYFAARYGRVMDGGTFSPNAWNTEQTVGSFIPVGAP